MIKRSFFQKARHKLSRLSLKLLVAWIRFGHRHQHSHRLPVFLFLFLIVDGFVMLIPGVLLLIASVTISPKRWKLFGLIFAFAGTVNNALIYFICRMVSPDRVVSLIEYLHFEELWASAERALHNYGSYAAFIGAVAGLPTQMVLALIGITDAQILQVDPTAPSFFWTAILYAAAGHLLKGMGVAGLARFGWVKLEKKVQSQPKVA